MLHQHTHYFTIIYVEVLNIYLGLLVIMLAIIMFATSDETRLPVVKMFDGCPKFKANNYSSPFSHDASQLYCQIVLLRYLHRSSAHNPSPQK